MKNDLTIRIKIEFGMCNILAVSNCYDYRVAGGCYQPQAPKEPRLIVSHHTAQASQRSALVGPPVGVNYTNFTILTDSYNAFRREVHQPA
ncbi:MAG: hypothetical protein V3R78_05050 [Thermodesulfobacteriota bacterium]